MTNRFVAEITLVVDSMGTTQTFYFATSGFASKPTDTPANTYFAPRLQSAGTLQRELFSGSRVAGAVRPAFGELVLFNGDGALDAWVGYGVNGGKVTVRMGDEDATYPSGYTTVYVAYAQQLIADFDTIQVRLRDRLNLLDQPIVTTQFTGAGGLEGTTGVAGKLKQWVSSDPGFFPPVLINAATQLYFVQSTGAIGITASIKAYEGALEITKGADYPDAATCLSTAPAAGQVRFWYGAGNAGPVYMRLGTAPALDLRVYSIGYQASGSAWSLPAMAAAVGIAGGSGPVVVGAQFVDDNRSYMEVMQAACIGQNAYFGMTRLDAFVCAAIAVPDVSPLYTFTQHNAKNWSRSTPQDMDAPVWNVTVNSGTTWPSNLNASATANNKDYMSRDPWWCSFAAQDAAIKTANPGAISATLETPARAFQNTTDQNTFTSAYLALYGVKRDLYQCTVPMDATTVALELHDTVAVKLPRFGLGAGKNMRIVTQQIDCDQREIIYGLWG